MSLEIDKHDFQQLMQLKVSLIIIDQELFFVKDQALEEAMTKLIYI